ncbi:hypothetical protein CC80DRAFT_555424 [Byssothecium circinans]|uniref:Uncharacterized protein n=1 Tax=Byssothecium circinans TaxID=147558 RepID=A0A6A5TB46_9PLEO|nr:hypothetical protein CC80DRAFT_555424 [Byssothecium circinans]
MDAMDMQVGAVVLPQPTLPYIIPPTPVLAPAAAPQVHLSSDALDIVPTTRQEVKEANKAKLHARRRRTEKKDRDKQKWVNQRVADKNLDGLVNAFGGMGLAVDSGVNRGSATDHTGAEDTANDGLRRSKRGVVLRAEASKEWESLQIIPGKRRTPGRKKRPDSLTAGEPIVRLDHQERVKRAQMAAAERKGMTYEEYLAMKAKRNAKRGARKAAKRLEKLGLGTNMEVEAQDLEAERKEREADKENVSGTAAGGAGAGWKGADLGELERSMACWG